jgi:hypothetical protein
MMTLEKWLTLNGYGFAASLLKRLEEIAPIRWNAIPCTEDSKMVLIYHESADRTHYIDFEIDSDETFFWFYRNRLTDEIDGSESPESELSDALKEKLGRIHA